MADELSVSFLPSPVACYRDSRHGPEETMTNPDNRQVGGSHYLGKAIQPWDYIAANRLGYFEGNVVKYVTRWRERGGVADLEKAKHYLEKLIEMVRESEARAEGREG